MKKIKVCVVGAGQFSQCFVPLYQSHPMVAELSLCEIDPDRLKTEASRLSVSRTFTSYADVLKSDVDAVAIFTQRWMHAPMAFDAMSHGKHVYSAVPAGVTLEELSQLIDAVKRTGLTYMMGETSMYYGARLFCREKWDAGEFGRFVYGEGEYLHDMSHGFYSAFQYSGGENWKSTASFPPMLYPTHSVAMVLSVTGASATKVSCFGVLDHSNDGVFDPKVSLWQNALSNQSALFQTSDGGTMRINEFRRVGTHQSARSVRGSIFGTLGSFEEQPGNATWTGGDAKPIDVEPYIKCGGVYGHDQWQAVKVDVALKGDFESGFGEIHQKYRGRLPDAYRTQPNGHEGSHQFLTNDFITAILNNSRPTVSVWDAARFNAPGIVAHASALRDGELLTIPAFSE